MKRTVKDIIIKGIKYIILIFLLIATVLFIKKQLDIKLFLIVNIISSIYVIIYKIIYRKEILENKKATKNKYISILSIIVVIIVLVLCFKLDAIIYAYALINLYFTGRDVFNRLLKKTQSIVNNAVELIIIYMNNVKCNKKANKEKNILILISKLNSGGAERVAANLANEFKKKYNNVIVLTFYEKTKEDYECDAKHIQIQNKKIKRINEIKEIKKKYNITHSISFCTNANYLNVASNIGEKVIISVRNYLSNSNEKEKSKIKAKISAKYADKIVTVSKRVEIDQIENYQAKKEKVITINNFYDEEIINKSAKQKILSIKEQNFFDKYDIIITIGRLTYQKGQWYLIRAFKEVLKECPNARLVILGKGKDMQKLKELINALQLEKYVKLYGFRDNPYQYLSKAKIFVLSSLYEGMSNAILEAMICGLPIIATDCLAGNREILAPNTNIMQQTDKMELAEYGVIVPVGDGKHYKFEKLNTWERELQKAMIKLLKDEGIREKYKRQSEIRIRDFQKEKIIGKWYSLIEGE